MDTSSLKLKQSGLTEPGYEKMKSLPQRYPGQFDDTSAKTDITEADIQTYVRRVAAKAIDRAETRGEYSNYETDVTEDCAQNECYKQYLNGDIVKKLEPSKKIFYDGLKDIISSKPAAYEEDDESDVETRSRIDELLQNRNPRCDYNQIEKKSEMEDLRKAQETQGTCSYANPNRCDPVVPTEDCGNRQCYKKYLVDELNMGEKNVKNVLTQSGMMRVRFSDTQESPVLIKNVPTNKGTEVHPNRIVQKDDFKKKYNTLVVSSDIAVPDFIDVLVVVSERPIKITLPELSGPSLSSSVGKVATTSNIMIKNLSLCNHQIVTKGNNKIDTVRTSVSIEPAGKKTLGAIHDSWILF